MNPQFGGKLTAQHLRAFERSKAWNGKIFENQTLTAMDVHLRTMPDIMKENFRDKEKKSPPEALDILPLTPSAFTASPDKPKFVWYGHSVLLLQLNGKNLLIDPMFGSNASPLPPFSVKRFSNNTLDLIDTLPPIDAVLLTHDHYDHLDYNSMKRIIPKVNTYLTALGVGRHLERWGVPSEQITEFDWWEDTEFQDIRITFTPSRHFSGRGPFDRAKSLWGGWILETGEHKIYLSGDGGYDSVFKQVGEKYGPFDWAFMECGQYNKYWHQIHMYPEESVQAAQDAMAHVAIPVHWGGFSLAPHAWNDPIIRFTEEAAKKGLQTFTPRLGDVVTMGDPVEGQEWWKGI
ncbi:MAG: MBL fold metallo-hydrolase [Flavobacteriales bacterium]|nr:MBL fold metallo-hydrolase [Flavobacteriales bacterium]